MGGGTFLPPMKRSSASARPASQRQRVANIGEVEHGLLEHCLDAGGVEEMKNVGERKAVLLAERNVQAVVRGGSLQFEIERTAEALAQREAPGFIDAAAEGRVDYELHAAAFIEEALGDDSCLRGNGAAARRGLRECIATACSAPGLVQAAFVFEPLDGCGSCGEIAQIG